MSKRRTEHHRQQKHHGNDQQRHSAGAPMVVLAAGGLAVAGLVAWAVTRSMQAPIVTPAPPPAISEPAAPPDPDDAPAAQTQTQTQTPPASPHVQEPDRAAVPRVEVAELKKALATGTATIVDVRDVVSYSNGHVPGAMNLPLARIEGELRYLPKGKPVIAYCT